MNKIGKFIRKNCSNNYYLLSSNLLEGTGDDEVGVVHGNQVSGELAREVVVVLELLPVEVRVRVLSFLKGMSNGTLHIKGKGNMSNEQEQQCKITSSLGN
jgi:hypothetical protein